MSRLRQVSHLATGCTRAIVRALTRGFDALTGPVGRLNDRVEAHLRDRTSLLRAHYARSANRQAAPLPVLDGPIDLALRGGIREPASSGQPRDATAPQPSVAVRVCRGLSKAADPLTTMAFRPEAKEPAHCGPACPLCGDFPKP